MRKEISVPSVVPGLVLVRQHLTHFGAATCKNRGVSKETSKWRERPRFRHTQPLALSMFALVVPATFGIYDRHTKSYGNSNTNSNTKALHSHSRQGSIPLGGEYALVLDCCSVSGSFPSMRGMYLSALQSVSPTTSTPHSFRTAISGHQRSIGNFMRGCRRLAK